MTEISQKFIDEIKNAFSSPRELEDFLYCCKIPLKKSIKININKILPITFEQITKPWGWVLTDTGFFDKQNFKNDTFYIDRENTDIPLGKTFLHQSGFFYVQEISASMPAKFLDIKQDDLVLDISAAPGGKTCQISDYLLFLNKQKPGFVVSNDVDKNRLRALSHNVNRLGAYNVGITSFNGFAFGKNLPQLFDHVLVDAPCSGEGTGFKSDSALKFWHKQQINKIVGTQKQLLMSAIKTTKVGGSIVYSTCTVNPYENEGNVLSILKEFEGIVELENVEIIGKSEGIKTFGNNTFLDNDKATKVARFWPHIQKTGGFFIAKFKKIGSLAKANEAKTNILAPKNPFRLDFSTSLQNKIKDFLFENFGIDANLEGMLFLSTGPQVYVVSSRFLELKDKIGFEKIGVPILKIDSSRGFLPLHGFGLIFGAFAKKNFVEIDEKLAQEYAFGGNLPVKSIEKQILNKPKDGYIVIKRNGYGLGVGKIVDDYIKNKYIKV